MNKTLIQQVFSEMDYGIESKKLDNTEAKRWIEDHKKFNYFVKGTCLTTSDISEYNVELPYNERGRIAQMLSLAEIIKNRKTFIATVCMELNACYSQNGVLVLIDELIDHVEYCARDKLLNSKVEGHINIRKPINFTCTDPLPLRFISSHIIPEMANGWQGTIFTVDTNIGFFFMFAELCTEAGFSSGSVTISKDLPDIKGIPMESKVDMLIFEDADLHYAVSTIEQAIWNIAQMNPFVLNKVLIQESVSKTFKSMLKERIMHNAERPINNFISEDDASNEINSALATTDFSEKFLLDKKVAVLFNKQEDLKLKLPVPVICVDTFRTEAEAVSLFTTDNNASLWVENGASARRIANKLQATNVWVNGYGLIHPTTSVTSSLGFSANNPSLKKLSFENLRLSEFGIKHSLTVNDLIKCNTKCIQAILSEAAKNIETSAMEKLGLSGVLTFWNAVSVSKNESVTTDAFHVDIITMPRGIILIELLEDTPFVKCVYALSAAIAFGNAVIIWSNDKLYKDLIMFVECCRFPENLVTVCKSLNSEVVLDILHRTQTVCFWTFNSKKLYSTMLWDSKWKYTNIENIINFSVSQIKQISTTPKFLWFHNK